MKKHLKKIYWIAIIIIAIMLLYPVGYYVLPTAKPVQNQAQTNIKQGSMHAYLINLDRSIDRLQYVTPKIEALNVPFTRIPGVDGSLLSAEQINSVLDLKRYKSYLGHAPKVGTIGCSLSHIKAWRAFLNSNHEYAVIFEDDISFDAAALSETFKQLLNNTNYWDIVNLEIHHRGAPVTLKKLDNGQDLVTYFVAVTHTGAYVINRKAATQLLSRALPIVMPVDHMFSRGWELDLKFTGVENPRGVFQTHGSSEIETSKKMLSDVSFLTRVRKSMYDIQTDIIRFFYSLRLYFG